MKLAENGIPRRNRIDLLTTEERFLREAMLVIENMPAHPLLTDASQLIGKARERLADFVELTEAGK